MDKKHTASSYELFHSQERERKSELCGVATEQHEARKMLCLSSQG